MRACRFSEGAVGRGVGAGPDRAARSSCGRLRTGANGRTSMRRSPLAGTAGPSDLQPAHLHSTEGRGYAGPSRSPTEFRDGGTYAPRMADHGQAALRLLDPRWTTVRATVRQWTEHRGMSAYMGRS